MNLKRPIFSVRSVASNLSPFIWSVKLTTQLRHKISPSGIVGDIKLYLTHYERHMATYIGVNFESGDLLVAWQYRVTTCTNVDSSSKVLCGTHLSPISQDVLKISIRKMSLKKYTFKITSTSLSGQWANLCRKHCFAVLTHLSLVPHIFVSESGQHWLR